MGYTITNFSAASSSLFATQTNNIHNHKLQKARSSSSSFSLNTTHRHHRQPLHLHFHSSNVLPLRSTYTRSLSHSSMVLSIVSFFNFIFIGFEFRLIEWWLIFFQTVKAVAQTEEPLHVMISGAPASGKGTQCQLIANKVRLFNSIWPSFSTVVLD